MSSSDGYVSRIDAREIGLTVVDMGGGRRRKADIIDHRVGVTLTIKVGDWIARDQPLCFVHAADEGAAASALDRLARTFELQPTETQPLATILARITP
jgi:thymidine phosphorylase